MSLLLFEDGFDENLIDDLLIEDTSNLMNLLF